MYQDLSLDHPNWTVLKTVNGLANAHEDITDNVRANLHRSVQSLSSILGTKSGAVAIVGSGPL